MIVVDLRTTELLTPTSLDAIAGKHSHKMTKHSIIEKEIKLAAKRWRVEPKDIITKRDTQRRCHQVPEYCARYDVIKSLQDQQINNATLSKLFGYKDPSSISQLVRKFEKRA